jgi:hypothetical protein
MNDTREASLVHSTGDLSGDLSAKNPQKEPILGAKLESLSDC